MSTIEERAALWLKWDCNPKTRQGIESLLHAGKTSDLKARLEGRLEFGTAGSCKYLEDVHGDGLKEKGVVVGYDGRHNSETFALITALVFMSRGVRVYLHEHVVPTPVTAFSVLHLKAAAGIMVTASHNPKQDNGYKVYWDNGAQIVSPHDKGISRQIDANLAPWFDYVPLLAAARADPLCVNRTLDVSTAYFAAVRSRLCKYPTSNGGGAVKIAYTAMHGVGHKFAARAFAEFGLAPFVSTPQQQEPDPEFPTVVFPNPQEGKGALELAMRTADAAGATVIVANDPDADRMAAAAKKPSGEWHIFHGNEIGALLAGWQWENFLKQNPTADRVGNPHTL